MAEAGELPWLVRRELEVLRASAGVDEASVRLEAAEDSVRLEFSIATEKSVNPPQADIRAVEPIAFVFSGLDAIGLGPPSQVLSLRGDFPRDLGHLNPAKPGAPASLCIAVAGLGAVYDRFGLEGVLERLRSFLRDAKIGALMQDGWEPTPYGDTSKLCPGSLDIAFFQDLALARPEGGAAFGVARVAEEFSVLLPHEIEVRDLGQAIIAQGLKGQAKNETLWVFVWPPAAQQTSAACFGDWTTYGEVAAGLDALGLRERYETAFGQALTSDRHRAKLPINVAALGSARTVIAVIGAWRPLPMRAGIFGLSSNDEARKLEVRAYRVKGSAAEEPLDASHEARAIVAHCFTSPKLFQFVAGVPVQKAAALIGAGALGSAIAEELLRSGCENLLVVDNDRLAPHNLARHVGRRDDLFGSKGDTIEALAASLGFPEHAKVTVQKRDVTLLSEEDFARTLGETPLIEATASERVRRYIAKLQQSHPLSVLRAEIFDRGRLGVLFASHRSGADLLDLYCCLLLAAQDCSAVSNWIDDEHTNPASLDQLQFGFGCASQTIKLPNYAVRQHAAAFMPTINAEMVASSVELSALDANLRPRGWHRIEVPDFRVWTPTPRSDWRVHAHPAVIEKLERLRLSALPNETGGYLYGGWDAALQSISIVFASDEPPGTKATPSSLELGPAGHTDGERRLLRATRSRLHLVGSWHSHPGSSSALSTRDHGTIAGYAVEDRRRYVPTLAVVVADNNFTAHLDM